MTIKLLIDMNLSPDWVPALAANGWQSVHWSTVGSVTAADQEIMSWALANGYVVFAHDLDFGTMLALTHSSGPSVIQVRTQNILPGPTLPAVLAALTQHESDLIAGALLVVDPARARVRLLPI